MAGIKYKGSDGQWHLIQNVMVNAIDVVQTSGTSSADVMSQSAVTSYITVIDGNLVTHTSNDDIHLSSTEKRNLDSLADNIGTISGITSTKVSNWDAAATSAHSHTNKSYIDTVSGNVGTMAYENVNSYSSATEVNTALGEKADNASFTGHTADTNVHFSGNEKANLDSLATNIAAISGISSTKVDNWDAAYGDKHSHSNKSALDAITSNVGTMAYENTSSYSSATEVNSALALKGDKSDVDDLIAQSEVIAASLNDLNERKFDASGITNYTTTATTSALNNVVTAHTADTNVHLNETEKTNIDSLATNIATISGITSADVENWDDKVEKDGYYDELHSGLADNLFGSTQTNDIFTFRPTAGMQDVASGDAPVGGGTIKKVEGNAVSWNQLCPKTSIGKVHNFYNVTYTPDSNGIIVNGTTEGDYSIYFPINVYFLIGIIPIGHKLFVTCTDIDRYDIRLSDDQSYTELFTEGKSLFTNQIVGGMSAFIRLKQGLTANNELVKVNVIDLTLLGIDNLTTVEEVEQWLANNVGLKDYYPYNEGELIPVKDFKVKSVGFNLWDEEWELGLYNGDTGEKQTANNRICSKNHIPVLPNTAYWYYNGSGISSYISFYDSNKNYLGYIDYFGGSASFLTPSNCRYINFSVYNDYGTTYNHDICINLAYDDRDGEYEEHWEREVGVDVTKVYGKLNGAGEYVQCFPDGMKRVHKWGNEYDFDSIDLKNATADIHILSMDIGTDFNWNFNEGYCNSNISPQPAKNWSLGDCISCAMYLPKTNASGWQSLSEREIGHANGIINFIDSSLSSSDVVDGKIAKLNGVKLYYVPADSSYQKHYTDLIYRDNGVDTPVSELVYRVDNYGTEEVLLGNDEGLVSSSPKMTISYGINAADTIADLPHSYISNLPQQLDEDKQKQARQNINAASQDSIIRIQEQLDAINPKVDNDVYVDMGLPSGLLWAKRNIDVTQPDGFAASEYSYDASFFSWGNVEGHNPTDTTFDYSFDATTYASTPGSKLTGNISLSYDAARAALGAPWRIPSADEIQELLDNCDFIDANGDTIASTTIDKIVTMNGVNGIRLKSKNNGRILFFPACGFASNGGLLSKDSIGRYWTNSNVDTNNASDFFFYNIGVFSPYQDGKIYGMVIRPVM